MIELTSHDESVAEGVPVEMTPKLDGQWRWLGTETLVFEMSPRLPMATEYSVVVPAGTRSLSGNILEAEYRFSFRTPPPKVLHWTPSDSPQNLEPTLSIQFNQAIDIESVLKKVRVNAGGTDFAVEPTKETRDILGQPVDSNLTETLERHRSLQDCQTPSEGDTGRGYPRIWDPFHGRAENHDLLNDVQFLHIWTISTHQESLWVGARLSASLPIQHLVQQSHRLRLIFRWLCSHSSRGEGPQTKLSLQGTQSPRVLQEQYSIHCESLSGTCRCLRTIAL